MKKIDKKKAGIAIAAVPVIAAGTVAMVSAYKQGMEFTPTDGRKDFQANKVVFENDENALEHQDSASDEESRLLQQKNSEQNQGADLQNQADYLFEDQKVQQETGTAYLFIAHDLSMVKYISDRIGVLHLGHLLETGTTEEIFENPIHPYTKSLLSAIPAPNPVVEKNRVALSYDYKTSGIDYNKGTDHLVSGTHYVKCTDEEFKKWTE